MLNSGRESGAEKYESGAGYNSEKYLLLNVHVEFSMHQLGSARRNATLDKIASLANFEWSRVRTTGLCRDPDMRRNVPTDPFACLTAERKRQNPRPPENSMPEKNVYVFNVYRYVTKSLLLMIFCHQQEQPYSINIKL